MKREATLACRRTALSATSDHPMRMVILRPASRPKDLSVVASRQSSTFDSHLSNLKSQICNSSTALFAPQPLLCFHTLTNTFSRNAFSLTSLRKHRGCHPLADQKSANSNVLNKCFPAGRGPYLPALSREGFTLSCEGQETSGTNVPILPSPNEWAGRSIEAARASAVSCSPEVKSCEQVGGILGIPGATRSATFQNQAPVDGSLDQRISHR